MAAYEQVRPLLVYFLASSRVVVAWVSADVGHVDTDALTLPMQILRQLAANLCAIDISKHTAQKLERLQPIQHFDRAEVAGVPNFIALFKVSEYGLVQKTMRVGQQTDLHPLQDTDQAEQDCCLSGLQRHYRFKPPV